jgi:hypothetical protein
VREEKWKNWQGVDEKASSPLSPAKSSPKKMKKSEKSPKRKSSSKKVSEKIE